MGEKVLIVRPRQTGKTTEIIRWWLEHPEVRRIICHSCQAAEERRSFALKIAEDDGADQDRLNCIHSFAACNIVYFGQLRQDRTMTAAVDDAEVVLMRMLKIQGVRVEKMTISIGANSYEDDGSFEQPKRV